MANNVCGGHALRIAVGITMLGLLLAGGAGAAILTVDDSGGADYTRIQDAINNASSGDTILVYSGTYYERVIVDKQITLKGIDYPLIDAQRLGSPITIMTGSVTVDGFKVTQALRSFSEAGIKVQYYSGGNDTIKNNMAYGNTIGIYAQKTSGNSIINNTVYSNDYRGIDLWVESNDYISNNTIYSNNYFGVIVSSSSNTLIEGNTIYSQTDGYWGSGIWIDGWNNIVKRNVLFQNTRGIGFESGSQNFITQNNITDNNNGITWNPNVANNLFYHNNFINNTNQVSWFGSPPGINIWDIDYPNGGNYWSDYTGSDLNSGVAQDQPGSDGIGDTPYSINGGAGNRDTYPFMNINGWVGLSDTTPPVITFTAPTPQNNSEVNVSYVLINITLNEAGTTSVLNWNGINETMNGFATNFYIYKYNLLNGNYTYKVYAEDISENWNVSETRGVVINVPTPNINPPFIITNLQNITYAQTFINWTWTDPSDTNFSKVMIYLNGTFQRNVTNGTQYYNATGLTPNTIYEIGTRTVDKAGNINSTWVNGTAKTLPSLNTPPTAYFTFSPATPNVSETVTFDAASSSDSDGTIADYSWNFGDGTTGNGKVVTHSYSDAGVYVANLTVTDNAGGKDRDLKTIVITSDTYKNIALNPGRTGYPNPTESDNGWGGGTDKWDIIDGIISYSYWANGLAFCGGIQNWCGKPAGWYQATINFGENKTFDAVRLWHHGTEHVPSTYKIQYWNGSGWVDTYSTTNNTRCRDVNNPGDCILYGASSWSSGITDAFDNVTSSKIRYILNNYDITHGWIYEFEVFGKVPEAKPPITDAFNGTVREFSTSIPIAGALVEAMQNDIVVASTSTNSKGNYSLSLPSGNYKLRASANGHIMEIKPVVSTGAIVNFDLRSGRVLVFEEFVQPVLNTSLWNSLTTGIGYITFANYTYSNSNFAALVIGSGYGGAGSGSISSKTSTSLADYDVLIFEGRIDAYEDNNYGYGDKQPRGLRVSGDGNNAIEFISATGSSIQTRTVSSGVATTTNYNLGESVNQWKYVYRIEASSTIVKFYLNGILIATHTSNIPTGNLSIYIGTNYGGYGNVPISADYIYLGAIGIDTTQPSSVTNLKNISYAPAYINWTWTDPADSDFTNVSVWIDGVFKDNVSKGLQFYNATGFAPDTEHTIATRTVDTSDNINQTWVNHTARTAPLLDTTPPASITNLAYTNGTTWINWTWTNPLDVDFNYTMVYLNRSWKLNTSNPFYNAAGLSPDTLYEIGTKTVDKSGNINTSWVNGTAKTLSIPTPEVLQATVIIKPETLNRASQSDKNAVTVYIEIPDYDVNAINVSTVTLNTPEGNVSAQLSPTEVGDYDGDGIPDMMVKFDRQAVIAIVDVGDKVKITIRGKIAGTFFEGTDEIRVI